MKQRNRNRGLILIASVFCTVVMAFYIIQFLNSYSHGIHSEFNAEMNRFVIAKPGDGFSTDHTVQQGDVLISVEGIEIKHRDDTMTLRRITHFNPSIDIVVEREGELLSLSSMGIQNTLDTRAQIFIPIGGVMAILGFWIAWSRPTYMAAITAGMSIFLLGIILMIQPVDLGPITPFAAVLGFSFEWMKIVTVLFFFHFALIFPRPGKVAVMGWPLKAVYASTLIFLPMFLVYFVHLSPGWIKPLARFFNQYLGLVAMLWVSAMLAITATSLIHKYLNTSELNEKRRIRWIMVGLLVPILFILIHIVLEDISGLSLGTPIWVRVVTFLTLPVMFFYAIIRHRSLDISLIIRKGLVYTSITGVILLATFAAFLVFLFLPLMLRDNLSSFAPGVASALDFFDEPNVQRASIAIWAVAVGATIGRFKRKAQNTVDRIFYRQQFSYREALSNYAKVLEQSHSPEAFADKVIQTTEDLLHPATTRLAIYPQENKILVRERGIASKVEPGSEDYSLLSQYFSGGKTYLGTEEAIQYSEREDESMFKLLLRLECDLIIPLKSADEIFGYLFLGKKKSELPYNHSDIELLTLLASQIVIGIERLRLNEEVAKSERARKELEIGQEIQRSLLPAKTPDIEGAEIAAVTIPATEVGGDFYTFIEYGPQKTGLIAGDIVGKGVGGALNMAATLSSLSILAEKSDSIAETMGVLNEYLMKKAAARTFAAVAFAITDLEEMTFRWCNAGLPEPILIPREGSVRYLEMDKYPLPPGAAMRSTYREQQYRLNPGDTIVLLTDGVTEVRPMKSDGDYFGFTRLLSFFEEVRSQSPADMLELLKQRLFEFREGTELEDDLTAVILHIKS